MTFVKFLHCRIFRPKILHRKFHWISTVLVIITQKMSVSGDTRQIHVTFQTIDQKDKETWYDQQEGGGEGEGEL